MTLERTPGVLLQHCEVDLDASDLRSVKRLGDRPHARVTRESAWWLDSPPWRHH